LGLRSVGRLRAVQGGACRGASSAGRSPLHVADVPRLRARRTSESSDAGELRVHRMRIRWAGRRRRGVCHCGARQGCRHAAKLWSPYRQDSGAGSIVSQLQLQAACFSWRFMTLSSPSHVRSCAAPRTKMNVLATARFDVQWSVSAHMAPVCSSAHNGLGHRAGHVPLCSLATQASPAVRS